MEIAELAVKKALELGATEVEVYAQKTKNVRVEFDEIIQSLKTTESLGIGLQVALGRKIATCATSVLDEKEISEIVARTVKIAKVAPEDPHWKHMNKKFGKAPAQEYYDKTLESLEHEEIIEKLIPAIDLMKNYDKRVKPTRGILNVSTSNVYIINNYNESSERRESNIEVWMRTKAKEASMESTGNEHQETRFWKETKFEELAEKAAEKAVKFLKAKPIKSGQMAVVFRNQIFANIFGWILNGPITAEWVQKGRSPLANKIGTQIASEDLSIVDDGLMPKGWRTKPFDDEGHPTQRTSIIERGVLKNYIYDNYTAIKDNVESTGNAFRNFYWVNLQPAPSNLILKAGKATIEEIIKDTRKGVFVEETIGEWLSNPVSGNLNATISHGYLIENGELAQPIKGAVISGNFYDLLKDGIEIVGNDLRNSAHCYSPTVKLTKLTLAGQE
ncbi:MAG: TldD/PmbA family protein [Candidatus Bathyarchaeota archaeon]|jgi:PmbA protein|nr:TldD/PmbA family protein [Candidatus Bathyarchaeota archaeon A05DMB-5]MDH7557871.1 TldD/PmbA family protein [Candidatus Bathyarchaeota archaeon]